MAFFSQIQFPVYITPKSIRRIIGTQDQSTNDDDILLWQADMISRRIEDFTNRRFFCYRQVIRQNWPGTSFVLYTPEDLHTVYTITNGNGAIIPASVTVGSTTTQVQMIYPEQEYPKYRIELAINSGVVWLFVGTPQQAITLDCLWGFPYATNTGQHNIATNATVQDATGQNATQTTLLVQSGIFQVGHTILVEDEFQIVQDITTGVANDTLTVLRGACGTTAIAHAKDTAIKLEVYNPTIVNAAYRWVSNLYRQKDAAVTDQVGFTGMGQLTTPLSMPKDVEQMLSQYVRRSH